MTALLEVRNLCKRFRSGGNLFRKGAYTQALDNVSFSVARGGTLGVVGESGSGKSTVARILCRLLPADGGEVLLEGNNILGVGGRRGLILSRRIQIVLQDPTSSLNPRWKVADLVEEGLRIHRMGTRAQQVVRRKDLLELCGLPRDAGDRYPHEFSGGQRQRIAIARALALNPDILVLDEPVSALDVSVQAQIMLLLQELQAELGMTYVFISHDLALVEAFCDEVVVMNGGKVVESGSSQEIYAEPKSEYTRTLIDAHPIADPRRRRRRGNFQ